MPNLNVPLNLDRITNQTIFNSFMKTKSVCEGYSKILCSVSGGADSDIMIDILHKLEINTDFIFFNTGLEYEATKKHIEFLSARYKKDIIISKPQTPIPTACKKYGLPFLSKSLSDKIDRLQSHDFDWSDNDFETLYKRYPKCKAALRWWCNKFGENSRYNIAYTKGLKEFLIANPPKFRISAKCCNYAKKDVAKDYIKTHNIQLSLIGVRKAEGGVRNILKSCFDEQDYCDVLRPIFWYKMCDRIEYEKTFNIIHSNCYSFYGLPRTGCAGCPFARGFENELQIMKEYEPKLYNAANSIFNESYQYTKDFYRFRKNL